MRRFALFLTVASAAVVRRGIGSKAAEKQEAFLKSLGEGWRVLRTKKGVLILVGLSSGVTLFMLGFGLFENMVPICAFGFLFFAALPFANNCLDYLMRTNIPDEAQGRAWGMIGFLSQLGYVVAYAVSGALADAVGRVGGIGVGRGAAWVITAAGAALALIASAVLLPKSIRELEKQ